MKFYELLVMYDDGLLPSPGTTQCHLSYKS